MKVCPSCDSNTKLVNIHQLRKSIDNLQENWQKKENSVTFQENETILW